MHVFINLILLLLLTDLSDLFIFYFRTRVFIYYSLINSHFVIDRGWGWGWGWG